MIDKEYITVGESLGISLTGIVVVFLALIFLAMAIMIVSKIVNSIAKDSPEVSTQNATAPVANAAPAVKKNDSLEPQIVSAIVGAINEEQRGRVESFRIVSITEKNKEKRKG